MKITPPYTPNILVDNPFSYEEWKFVSSKDSDLTDYNQARFLFTLHKPDCVIHLAAMVGGLYKNMNQNADFYVKNTQINTNVLKLAQEFNVHRVISCLSTCIFPANANPTVPLTEADMHSGPPHSSNFGYAYSKRMIDVMNRAYNEQYPLCNFMSVIPTNVYGPHDNFDPYSSHVVPGLLQKCILAKQNKTQLGVMGDGTALRQFIYSQDLAKLIVLIMREYHSNEPVILANEQELSIRDIVHEITTQLNFDGPVVWDTTKSNGQLSKTVSTNKLKSLFPDFQFTSFSDGLLKTIKWCKIN